MILLNNDMFFFSVKVLYSERSIIKIKLINSFERNLYFSNFLKSIVFKHCIITFSDLIFILLNFLVHLDIKTLSDSLSELWAEPVLDVDKNYEEKDTIVFKFEVLFLELLDLSLWEGLVKEIFETVDIFFMCIIGTDLILSRPSYQLRSDIEFYAFWICLKLVVELGRFIKLLRNIGWWVLRVWYGLFFW